VKTGKFGELLEKFRKAEGHLKDVMSDIGILPFEFEDEMKFIKSETMTSILRIFDIINYCHSTMKHLEVLVAANLFVEEEMSEKEFVDIVKKYGIDVSDKKLLHMIHKKLSVEKASITINHDGNPIYAWMVNNGDVPDNGLIKVDSLDIKSLLEKLKIGTLEQE